MQPMNLAAVRALLTEVTGSAWNLPDLLDAGLTPWFWLDYSPEAPAEIFNDRFEGMPVKMVFAGDAQRLRYLPDGDVSVTMYATEDERIYRCLPGIAVPQSELMFDASEVHETARLLALEKSQGAAPETASESGSADKPLPLTTGDIAFVFDGLRWDEQGWRKPLGDKPKWLQACIAIPGQQGVREATWNPVCIAARLVHEGHITARHARARFQTKPQLAPWLDAWKTYEADYLDSD